MLQGTPETIRRARRLRKEMSLPEILLWQELRKRPAGLKFRRQHPSGQINPDFYCHAIKLVVEVDGAAHDSADAARDAWLAKRGIRVLRIPARTILKDLDPVIRHIVATATSLLNGEGDQAKGGGGVSDRGDYAHPSDTPPSRLRRATSPSRGGSRRSA